MRNARMKKARMRNATSPGKVFRSRKRTRPWALSGAWASFCVGASVLMMGGAVSGAEPETLCRLGSGESCSALELSDPVRFPQVLVLPTGFAASEKALFESSFHRMVDGMSQSGSRVFADRYRQRLVYRSFWVPGGALGTPEAAFGGAVIPHPVRSTALTARQEEVIAYVKSLPENVAPRAVMILFNSLDSGVTANASPPSFLGERFGIAKTTLADIDSQYVPVHELAHAFLNFVDEYIEGGFESVAIQSFDAATSLLLMNGTGSGARQAWRTMFQIYDLRASEILAANGSENIDTSRVPTRVATEGVESQVFENEGGMFFGKGTWHDEGRNLMGGFSAPGENDGFAYDHSASQELVIGELFEHPATAARPNDRIAAAGPRGGWPSALGREAMLLLFDADKNHAAHPTEVYEVQVGFHDLRWARCRGWGGLPYPCLQKEWVTVQKEFPAVRTELSVPASRAFGIVRHVQKLACFFGVKQVGPLNLCGLTLGQMAGAFLPTLEFPLPYQEVVVPVPQALTRYHWRFRTRNKTAVSGWTGWSTFIRTF
jgi:hypothetical protein